MRNGFQQVRVVAAMVVGMVLVLGALIVSAFVLGIYSLSEDVESGRIAFVSDRDGDREIYVMDADGSGVLQLTDNEYGDGSPAWSPDCGRMAFTSDRDNESDIEMYYIYVMNADDSGVEQLTGNPWRLARACSDRIATVMVLLRRLTLGMQTEV